MRFTVRTLLVATTAVAVIAAMVSRAPRTAGVLGLLLFFLIYWFAADILLNSPTRRPAVLLFVLVVLATASLIGAGVEWIEPGGPPGAPTFFGFVGGAFVLLAWFLRSRIAR